MNRSFSNFFCGYNLYRFLGFLETQNKESRKLFKYIRIGYFCYGVKQGVSKAVHCFSSQFLHFDGWFFTDNLKLNVKDWRKITEAQNNIDFYRKISTSNLRSELESSQ